jgi:hypothetical protein
MLRTLVLFILAIVVSLGIAEIGLRVFFAVVPPPPDSVYLPDRDTGYRLRSDPIAHYADNPDDHVNQLGFRDREHPIAKPEHAFRIAGIGDSFVYGSTPQLRDHFLEVATARLGERLRSDSLTPEMILMGLGAYSPEHEVGLLRAKALPLSPDLVILNFYVGNDVTGIPIRGRVWRGRVYYSGSPYPLLDLLRQSRLFVLAETMFLTRVRGAVLGLWLKRGERRAAAVTGGGAAEGGAPPHARTLYSLHQQKKDLPVYARQPDRRTRGLWREAEGYLLEFDRLCREAHVRWMLHLIPAGIQVDSALRAQVLGRLGLPESRYDFDGPQRRLHAFAEARGVPTCDPLATLRAERDRGPDLYERNDIHWTVRGNRVAGEVLADSILAQWDRLGPAAPR